MVLQCNWTSVTPTFTLIISFHKRIWASVLISGTLVAFIQNVQVKNGIFFWKIKIKIQKNKKMNPGVETKHNLQDHLLFCSQKVRKQSAFRKNLNRKSKHIKLTQIQWLRHANIMVSKRKFEKNELYNIPPPPNSSFLFRSNEVHFNQFNMIDFNIFFSLIMLVSLPMLSSVYAGCTAWHTASRAHTPAPPTPKSSGSPFGCRKKWRAGIQCRRRCPADFPDTWRGTCWSSQSRGSVHSRPGTRWSGSTCRRWDRPGTRTCTGGRELVEWIRKRRWWVSRKTSKKEQEHSCEKSDFFKYVNFWNKFSNTFNSAQLTLDQLQFCVSIPFLDLLRSVNFLFLQLFFSLDIQIFPMFNIHHVSFRRNILKNIHTKSKMRCAK